MFDTELTIYNAKIFKIQKFKNRIKNKTSNEIHNPRIKKRYKEKFTMPLLASALCFRFQGIDFNRKVCLAYRKTDLDIET